MMILLLLLPGRDSSYYCILSIFFLHHSVKWSYYGRTSGRSVYCVILLLVITVDRGCNIVVYDE